MPRETPEGSTTILRIAGKAAERAAAIAGAVEKLDQKIRAGRDLQAARKKALRDVQSSFPGINNKQLLEAVTDFSLEPNPDGTCVLNPVTAVSIVKLLPQPNDDKAVETLERLMGVPAGKCKPGQGELLYRLSQDPSIKGTEVGRKPAFKGITTELMLAVKTPAESLEEVYARVAPAAAGIKTSQWNVAKTIEDQFREALKRDFPQPEAPTRKK